MTGMHLYQNRLIARSDSGSVALTNAYLDIADNAGDTDITAIYSENSGVLNVKSGESLTVWTGDSFTPGGTVNVGSGVTIRGTLSAGSNTITLSGSLLNAGTFTAGTSTVALNGTGQSLSGSTTFYNLSKVVTTSETLLFAASQTFTITNSTTLKGTEDQLLHLRSAVSGQQWTIDPRGTRNIAYVDVKDSNNGNDIIIDPSASADSGNNTNWFPGVPHSAPNAGGGTRSGGSEDEKNALPDAAPGEEGTGEEQEEEREPLPVAMEQEDGSIRVTIGVIEEIPSGLSLEDRERFVRERMLERAGARPSLAAKPRIVATDSPLITHEREREAIRSGGARLR